MPPPMDDASELVPSMAADVAKLVLPMNGEVAADDEPDPPQAFEGSLIELSVLPLYPNDTARHIWDGEVILFEFILCNLRSFIYYKFLTLQDRDPLKFINH